MSAAHRRSICHCNKRALDSHNLLLSSQLIRISQLLPLTQEKHTCHWTSKVPRSLLQPWTEHPLLSLSFRGSSASSLTEARSCQTAYQHHLVSEKIFSSEAFTHILLKPQVQRCPLQAGSQSPHRGGHGGSGKALCTPQLPLLWAPRLGRHLGARASA